jgi:hypothetical protein
LIGLIWQNRRQSRSIFWDGKATKEKAPVGAFSFFQLAL